MTVVARTWKQLALEGLNRALEPSGHAIVRSLPDMPGPYLENPEVGARNMSEKLARLEQGVDFEWPGMVALNRALVSRVAPAQRVVNIGAGTGTFEWIASEDPSVEFVASELDRDCVAWCREHRQRDNVRYGSQTMQQLLDEDGPFDLAISVDVIEHIADYAGFLREFSQLADRAILTTPNRARNHRAHCAMPPRYEQHVREWTAGEFFWVLRAFYDQVEMLALTDPLQPELETVGPLTTQTPLVAVCRRT
ncbi:MAG: methyltransferase domain-containing protein [bacterium]|nr:methyltransferase domain-containing protein [bacterium]